MMTIDCDEVRETWQPAPGSRLAVALDAAEELAARWETASSSLGRLQRERAAVQTRLDAVGPDSHMGAAGAAIVRAQALDLAIMRGKLELSRCTLPKYEAESGIAAIVQGLLWADRLVNDAGRRRGEASAEYQAAQMRRAAAHKRYLAAPEPAPVG